MADNNTHRLQSFSLRCAPLSLQDVVKSCLLNSFPIAICHLKGEVFTWRPSSSNPGHVEEDLRITFVTHAGRLGVGHDQAAISIKMNVGKPQVCPMLQQKAKVCVTRYLWVSSADCCNAAEGAYGNLCQVTCSLWMSSADCCNAAEGAYGSLYHEQNKKCLMVVNVYCMIRCRCGVQAVHVRDTSERMGERVSGECAVSEQADKESNEVSSFLSGTLQKSCCLPPVQQLPDCSCLCAPAMIMQTWARHLVHDTSLCTWAETEGSLLQTFCPKALCSSRFCSRN